MFEYMCSSAKISKFYKITSVVVTDDTQTRGGHCTCITTHTLSTATLRPRTLLLPTVTVPHHVHSQLLSHIVQDADRYPPIALTLCQHILLRTLSQ